ncbi:class I SAM-dependent methyltransferase [Rudaea cellulosilytica]|uniref:class I SAM-dependent methyltransferase n=1 Tax=Rudaea cellulosilytica TaxID=540746 RepID=UPI00039B985A|nr:methyltransferase domain-containing protein [Rudaea cellulosilytica]
MTQPQSSSTSGSQAWLFFRQWLKNPLSIAALAPSGAQLAGLMTAELPAGASRVIELGAGTGVFTRTMLDNGIAPEQLLVVELNEELYEYLRTQFPTAHVVCGNACDLTSIVAEKEFASAGQVDAIVSGLGLLNMSRDLQLSIMRSAFDVLKPGGCFIQFTYSPKPPLPRELLDELGLSVRRGGFAWRNIPPASVFVFSRNRSEQMRAVRK